MQTVKKVEMNHKYDEIIKEYFFRNRANNHLVAYGRELEGLLHSASLQWRVEVLERQFKFLQDAMHECLKKVEATPFYKTVKNEVRESLSKALKEVNEIK